MYSGLLVLLDVIGHRFAFLQSPFHLNWATAVYKTLMHRFPIVRVSVGHMPSCLVGGRADWERSRLGGLEGGCLVPGNACDYVRGSSWDPRSHQ